MSGTITCGMIYAVGSADAGVFAALSVVHVYWAFGGTVGLEAAIPKRPANIGEHASEGALVAAFQPSAALTVLVAGGLALVGTLVGLRAGVFAPARADWPLRWSLAAIALVLSARAVGDLNLVGFFKQIRGTRFAALDTWLYSPLCVCLALGLVFLAIG